MDQAIGRIADALDRSSPVSVSVQLRGAIEFGIASGELPAGARMLSVRAMAARCGLSPVTVSGVYAALQDAGHIEARVGSGTFVCGGGIAMAANPARLRLLDRKIADLLRLGRECGLGPAELARKLNEAPRNSGRPVRLLIVSNFYEATEAYAEALRPHLAAGDNLRALTLEALSEAPPQDVDMVLVPRTLRQQVEAIYPDLPVCDLTLIPNEATRVALASIATDARVVGYTYFPGFLTIMTAGIRRFAPHVSQLAMAVRGDQGAAQAIVDADVLIYATGADYLLETLGPGQTAFEYRHTPEMQSIRRDLLPAIEARRTALCNKDRLS